MAVSKGDKVTLPDRYGPVAGIPGEVASVKDGWAMVDCGSWGIFGMPADSIDPVFDQRWQMVTCSSCGRRYQCTPDDDYYNCTNDHDGVCETCLLRPHGFEPKDVQTYEVLPRDGTS